MDNRIEGKTNNIIRVGADVTYDAGNQVHLRPGFKALLGSRFHAVIDGCGGNEKINGEATSLDTNDIELKVYPNPLSETANISYRLADDAEVTISLFDSTGKQVNNLLEKQAKQAGEHQQKLDASNLPTGIYYLNLQSTQTNLIKKLMIAK